MQTMVSWNFTNWITITLMALIGFFVLSWGAQAIRGRG